MKGSSARVTNRLFNILLGLVLFTCVGYSAYGQVFKKPSLPKKKPAPVIKLSDLIIEDLSSENPDMVSIQIGNIGQANAVSFTIRLSFKKLGESQKTYVDKRVFGLKVQTDLAVDIKIGQPLKGLTIGVFIDADNEVPESNEENCGIIIPDRGAAGSLPCKSIKSL
jgi:hypothetical protein